MDITLKPDGSAICTPSTSIDEVRVRLEQAIGCFNKCRYRNKDKKCNDGRIADELGQSNLLLGKLTGRQEFVGFAFNSFRKRKPHPNEVGKLECLNWMINHSNLSNSSELSKIVKGIENLYSIFSILVPLTKLSTEREQPKRDQFLRDYGIETEISTHYYNCIHKPRIIDVFKNEREFVVHQTVKTVIKDINGTQEIIVKDLLVKSKKWFSEVTKAIDEQLQRVWASITLIEKSQNTEGRSTLFRRGNLSSSNDAFLQLIRLDIQNVKLENFLNKCNTDLDLNEKQKLILDKFERSYSAFTKCRTLIDDLVYAVQRRGIVTQIINLLKFLNVSQQMKMYFDSEFHKFRKSSRMRGNSVARCFEVLTFHKMFGMKHNVNNYHTNLEEKVLDELKKGILNRHGAISCGFIPNVSIKTPYVMSVVRSFSQSLDSLNIFHNPYIAFLKFCKFIDRMKIPQTDETIPELSLLLIWIKYFIFVGFSIHSKVFDLRNSGKHCYFVVPSSYFTVLDFIEKSIPNSNRKTTEIMIREFSFESTGDDVSDLLEKFIEIMIGRRGNINLISIVFKRLDDCLKLKTNYKSILKDDDKSLVSVIDMTEDVIALCMIYIINMGESMPYKFESVLLKGISVLRQYDKYPQNISDVLQGIQRSTGIADIFKCLNNLLQKRGESLIKCVWNHQKKCITKAEIENIFNKRENFFLPLTIRILLDPTLPAEQIKEEIETDQVIKIDEEEIRKMCDDHESSRKKQNEETLLLKVKILENQHSERQVGHIEFLEDAFFGRIITINETSCDVCDVTLRYDVVGDEDVENDVENISTESAAKRPSTDLTSDSTNLKSIARSLSSTSEERMQDEKPAKTQYWIPNEQFSDDEPSRSTHYLLNRSVSSQSEVNKEFVRSLSSNSDDQPQLTSQSFEDHIKSPSHMTKMLQIQHFYIYYKQMIKPDLEKVRDFISKYNLSSSDISERYGEDEIRISKLLRSFEECDKDMADIIRSKQWEKISHVKQNTQQLVRLQSELEDSVKELSSIKLKVSSILFGIYLYLSAHLSMGRNNTCISSIPY